jgi:hypothetical protein
MIGIYPSGIHSVPKKLGTKPVGQILVQVAFFLSLVVKSNRGDAHLKQ